jgi:hypothetical protein
MVRLIADKVGSRSLVVRTSPALAMFLLKIVGWMVRDVVLTRDELGALMLNLLVSKDPAVGTTRVSDWLDQAAETCTVTLPRSSTGTFVVADRGNSLQTHSCRANDRTLELGTFGDQK